MSEQSPKSDREIVYEVVAANGHAQVLATPINEVGLALDNGQTVIVALGETGLPYTPMVQGDEE